MACKGPVGWLAGLAVAAGLAGPAAADTGTLAPWNPQCTGDGGARRCSVGTTLTASGPRGDGALSLRLVSDGDCTTLHVVFDGTIAVDRPVSLAVDDDDPQHFYTGAELETLAAALDGGDAPAELPPEFRLFLARAGSGAFGAAAPADVMMDRFAAIKEPWRLGVSCGPMERLMPRIAAGRTLHLEYSATPAGTTEFYHWPALLQRRVAVDLAGAAAALDKALHNGTASAPRASAR
ncbi:hypothetical protein [Azospirillum halopraeferens]|uniref:hypothetical protein n=1 Tax=Azospirillum halopraeferens TaxID=34010 RepID=UPI00042A2923|nr:hypothetical protein [Azospirillum halopraeferens]